MDGQPYQRTLRDIYAFSEIRRTPIEVRLGRERKLDRIRTLLGLIGTPQAYFRTVLVAGTKGKGSTAACLASILEAAGYRVGRYTQPHLYSFRERTWACGSFITADEAVTRFEEMKPALNLLGERMSELGHLTTFDVGMALTLLHFARVGVDLAVVEVGVGGGHDATNILEPVLSLIGPVGIDHRGTLGDTVEEIAREKAGIARGEIDVLVGGQCPQARTAIRGVVAAMGGRIRELGRDFGWHAPEGCPKRFRVWRQGSAVEGVEMPLAGPCQRDNAAMAIEAARLLATSRRPVSDQAIREGMAQVHWPGRFQRVLDEPLTIVDGAHNPAAAAALAATLRECVPGRPINLVLGMSVEKDAAAFVDALAPLVDHVVVTRARHARSFDPEVLAAHVRGRNLKTIVATCPADALRLAWAGAPEGSVTLITGSLFLVGDILELLLHSHEVRADEVRADEVQADEVRAGEGRSPCLADVSPVGYAGVESYSLL